MFLGLVVISIRLSLTEVSIFFLILCCGIDPSTCASVYWERGRSGESGEVFSLILVDLR